MLPHARRLKDTAEFDRVFRDGRAAHGRLVSIRMRPADGFKAGFVVGKAVSQKAVVRNRTRRRLQEIVRAAGPGLGAVELVVSAKRAAADAGSPVLRDEITDLLGTLTKERA